MKQFLKVLLILCGLSPLCALAQPPTAKLFIFRKQTIGTPMRPEILVNDVKVSDLPNKSFVECEIPTGQITVSMRISSLGDDSREIKFIAEPDQAYYVKSSVNMIGGSPQSPIFGVNLLRTTEDDGLKKLKKCKEVATVDMTQYISPDSPVYAQQGIGSATKPAESSLNKKPSRKSDVDKDIPETKDVNSNTFVLIVANEDYAFLDNVPYAQNDGDAFKEYCIKTLGIPEKQIWMYDNASLGILSSGINKMVQAMNIFDDANAIIYYCGHGIPDEKTGDAYIVPTDGNGTDMNSCYSLNKLYSTMAKAAKGNVTYFLDACFTGAGRDGSMLVAARGVAREAKKESVGGNTVVFSASSGDETAMPFKEKEHGLFTYFLLKKLQESKGNITYGELAEYIKSNVKKEAFLTNSKPQNPVIATSANLTDCWKSLKMK